MKQKILNKNIIHKIESELLSALFNYIAPFIDKKIKATKKELSQKISDLEGMVNHVNNSKPKIDLRDVKELESLLIRNLNENIKINKNIWPDSKNMVYSMNFKRQKISGENRNNYSISIKYEENQQEEKLKISIKKDDADVYSAETRDKKDVRDKVIPYSIQISYEDSYFEERLSITYKQQVNGYLKQHIESKEDMTNRVPLKWLNIMPETMMGGVLGFTYLGENFMARRADLTGKTARMVDIHESIHTPDEYETRVLTSWIMERVRGKYVR